MTAKRECAGKIWGAYRDVSGRGNKCHRPATIEREGKWFCWQHDPNRRAEEAAERQAAEEARAARQAAKYTRITRNARLAQLVTPELAVLLERLADFAHIQGDWESPGDWGTLGDNIDSAHTLAARIREALEINDES